MESSVSPPVAPSRFVLKKGHKWFGHHVREADCGWHGPHNHIEQVLADVVSGEPDAEIASVFVCQGRRMTKSEQEEFAVDFSWQCETRDCLEIKIPHE